MSSKESSDIRPGRRLKLPRLDRVMMPCLRATAQNACAIASGAGPLTRMTGRLRLLLGVRDTFPSFG